MARTKAPLIFATFIASGIAVVLSFVALATQQWVVANVDLNTGSISTTNNKVHYGLFLGTYYRTISTATTFDLITTCDFGKNRCALLCGDADVRRQYLQYLFQNESSDGYRLCTSTRSLRGFTQSDDDESTVRADGDDDSIPDGFINSGAWLSTVIFLVIACLFGVISAVLALWNTVANPVESFISIAGLFVYNCVACGCTFIVLLLWGVQFAVTLTDNVAIHDTIVTSGISRDKASLGYSYWLNVIVLLLYGSSAAILMIREYLINKEPDNVVNIDKDNNDTTIILF